MFSKLTIITAFITLAAALPNGYYPPSTPPSAPVTVPDSNQCCHSVLSSTDAAVSAVSALLGLDLNGLNVPAIPALCLDDDGYPEVNAHDAEDLNSWLRLLRCASVSHPSANYPPTSIQTSTFRVQMPLPQNQMTHLCARCAPLLHTAPYIGDATCDQCRYSCKAQWDYYQTYTVPVTTNQNVPWQSRPPPFKKLKFGPDGHAVPADTPTPTAAAVGAWRSPYLPAPSIGSAPSQSHPVSVSVPIPPTAPAPPPTGKPKPAPQKPPPSTPTADPHPTPRRIRLPHSALSSPASPPTPIPYQTLTLLLTDLNRLLCTPHVGRAFDFRGTYTQIVGVVPPGSQNSSSVKGEVTSYDEKFLKPLLEAVAWQVLDRTVLAFDVRNLAVRVAAGAGSGSVLLKDGEKDGVGGGACECREGAVASAETRSAAIWMGGGKEALRKKRDRNKDKANSTTNTTEPLPPKRVKSIKAKAAAKAEVIDSPFTATFDDDSEDGEVDVDADANGGGGGADVPIAGGGGGGRGEPPATIIANPCRRCEHTLTLAVQLLPRTKAGAAYAGVVGARVEVRVVHFGC
ncbi:hypothetical protein R3P38DRAFT_3595861 [Favolaschia claudopus]|uniref:Uncharacterized protein n=1 Tax=Favolaschia claudopus TaxID=2862362 RepID=A0AAW0DLY6_9AGAR